MSDMKKIIFRQGRTAILISECDLTDIPMIPMVGDIVTLNDREYKVAGRKFDFDSYSNNIIVYVKDI